MSGSKRATARRSPASSVMSPAPGSRRAGHGRTDGPGRCRVLGQLRPGIAGQANATVELDLARDQQGDEVADPLRDRLGDVQHRGGPADWLAAPRKVQWSDQHGNRVRSRS